MLEEICALASSDAAYGEAVVTEVAVGREDIGAKEDQAVRVLTITRVDST